MKLKAYLAVAALCIIWGTSYLFIRYGVEAFPPFQFAGMRQTIGGLLLLGIVFLLQNQAFPGWQYAWKQAGFGLLMIGFGNGLVTWGVQYVPTGIAALLGSTVPIMVVIVNLILGEEERINRHVAIGVLLGFIGPLIIFGDTLEDFFNHQYTWGIVLIIVAGFGWALASVLSKDYNIQYSTMMNAGFQMLFGGIGLLLASLLLEKPTFAHTSLLSIWSLLYLAIVSSAVAFSLYLYALKRLPVTVVSLYSYVNPLIAILLGWIFLQEKLSWNIFFAFVVTAWGIYLVNVGFRRPRVV